jgi:hypothetical protein
MVGSRKLWQHLILASNDVFPLRCKMDCKRERLEVGGQQGSGGGHFDMVEGEVTEVEEGG